MRARRLTPEAYAPYGRIVAAAGGAKDANMGTARRWDRLAPLVNKRARAKANLCVFRCKPFKGKAFPVKLLERHAKSTQVFLPLAGAGRCLVIVAKGGAKPDLSTLAAFVMEGALGVSYHPGTWHHPMVALGKASDLACLVYEDGSKADCEVVALKAPAVVNLG
ncbi:MAG: ureidoglycolate hydrolase [Elusimicrobia bacterium]|nr:MAG: ureidoglycolate hydrolase [Elusimicrobiota bacterium]